MTAFLTVFGAAWEQLVTAFESTRDETVMVALAARAIGCRRRGLIIGAFEAVPDAGYLVRTPGSFQLAPAYVAEVALRAQASSRAVVVAHSHPGWNYPADFSPTDDRMNAALSRSLLAQIRGPFAALVRAPGGASASLWWTRERSERMSVRVGGPHLLFPSERTEEKEEDLEDWERQVRAFGRPAQRVLRRIRIGIVGTGGTGSIAGVSAAHLGVRDFMLVDPDRLERSNLSRVLGSRAADLAGPVAPEKIEVLARAIREVRPEAEIEGWPYDATWAPVLRALAECDLVLSCTDTHSSRAALGQLPFQYGVPVLDVGSLVRSADRRTEAFVDVRLATDGGACFTCQDVVDPARVLEERMAPEDRGAAAVRGYVAGSRAPEPSVLPVNELAVSLAMNRVLDLLEPWLDWPARVTVNIRTLDVIRRDAQSRAGCPVCANPTVAAAGDEEPMVAIAPPPGADPQPVHLGATPTGQTEQACGPADG